MVTTLGTLKCAPAAAGLAAPVATSNRKSQNAMPHGDHRASSDFLFGEFRVGASEDERTNRMNEPAPYFHWGFILISLPNLVLIGVMVLIFIVALLAPFPGHGQKGEHRDDG